jgi:hypothetical protein
MHLHACIVRASVTSGTRCCGCHHQRQPRHASVPPATRAETQRRSSTRSRSGATHQAVESVESGFSRSPSTTSLSSNYARAKASHPSETAPFTNLRSSRPPRRRGRRFRSAFLKHRSDSLDLAPGPATLQKSEERHLASRSCPSPLYSAAVGTVTTLGDQRARSTVARPSDSTATAPAPLPARRPPRTVAGSDRRAAP